MNDREQRSPYWCKQCEAWFQPTSSRLPAVVVHNGHRHYGERMVEVIVKEVL